MPGGRVLEHIVQGHSEDAGELERHFQRGQVALFDRDDCLTSHLDAFGELGLGEFTVGEAQGATPSRTRLICK